MKLHIHEGRGGVGVSSVGKKLGYLQKGNFVCSRKLMCEKAFQDLLEGAWWVLMKKHFGGKQKEEFL